MTGLDLRQGARAIIVGPEKEILLVRFSLHTGVFWATPGGGLEPGETHLQAVRRELKEEVGINPTQLIGPIWVRTHHFPLYGYAGQTEQYFMSAVEDLALEPSMSIAQLEAEGVMESRWWTVQEIAASSERFAPLDLADRLRHLFSHGPPAEPTVVGV